jgi:hypothetical protein
MTEEVSGKDVAVLDPKGQAVATYDYGDDAAAGFENVTSADLKIPFLRLLQSNSPQIETVPGAKAGVWINLVTNALFPDGIEFVPAHHEHYYVEYERDEKGQRLPGGEGFRGIHKATDPMVLKAIAAVGESKFVRGDDGKIKLPKSPDGFDLVETQYMYGSQRLSESGTILPAVIGFSSTHLQAYTTWLSTAFYEMIPGTAKSKPLFAHAYLLGSVKKTKGANSWYVPTISFVGGSAKTALLDPKSDVYQAARSIMLRVKEGKVDVDHAQAGAGDATGEKKDENIPF